jgi:L-malate glycosyltransferase
MRICFFADGRYIHTLRWMRFFTERGHDAHVISFAPLESKHVEAIEEAGGKFQDVIGGFHLKQFWVTARDLWKLKGALRRERIDVLHCHFLGANTWFAALSNFHPFVITVMGGGDVCGPQWKPTSQQRERILTPFALRKADLVTSWSYSMAKTVRPYCRKNVEVIHGGVDLGRFYPRKKPDYLHSRWNVPEGAKIVFSPRLMRPLSNIDVIVEAAVEICADRRDVYFLFAASEVVKDVVYEERVKAIVQSSSTPNNVKFIGSIAHEEMADYYRLADVTVSIPEIDGTPLTVLESMACGTPVVASDIPDYDPHYIESGKTVLSVRPRDTTGLAGAILRLLDDSDLANRLAAEAGNRVRMTGSYEAQMARMERLYLSLVNDA